jgi:hypothetical protein
MSGTARVASEPTFWWLRLMSYWEWHMQANHPIKTLQVDLHIYHAAPMILSVVWWTSAEPSLSFS